MKKNVLKQGTDESVVIEVLRNSDNYSEIIFRYEIKIKKYISRISKINSDDIDDLVQDVFLSAYENLNSFDTSLSFSSWIYRIAHNRTINFWKKYRREEGNINIEDHQYIVDSVFNEDSISMEMDNIDNKELIDYILKNMSAKYSEVLILKFLEQKDYKEISDILQKPMGSIATLINRAKKQFKNEVKKMETEFYKNKYSKK